MDKKLYRKAFDSVSISDLAVERLNSSLENKKAPKNPFRIARFIPALAIICAMGITVTAIGLSNRETVENIYFDRDYRHNLIMDINPQYGTYLTEEGIEQLESFEPIPLDTKDYSGNGNDLKSATLLGVMADKYTLTALIEVEFNKSFVIPEDNVAMVEKGEPGAMQFLSYISECDDYRWGDFNMFSWKDGLAEENEREVTEREMKFFKEHDDLEWDNRSSTVISVSPAEKPNTAVLMIENIRCLDKYEIEKGDTVRFTLGELGARVGEHRKRVWKPIIEGEYVFDVPVKELIPERTIKPKKSENSFVYDDLKYTIESVDISQGYAKINFTNEATPEYYERHPNRTPECIREYIRDIGLDSCVKIVDDKGRTIPAYYGYGSDGYNIFSFEKPQNEDSVGAIVIFDDTTNYRNEIQRISLK